MNALDVLQLIEDLDRISDNSKWMIWGLERLEKQNEFSKDFTLKQYLKANKEQYGYLTDCLNYYRKKLSDTEIS